MTARIPFTQQSVRRAIAAARKEGLYVLGVRPDGTVITGDNPSPAIIPTDARAENVSPSKWEDVEA